MPLLALLPYFPFINFCNIFCTIILMFMSKCHDYSLPLSVFSAVSGGEKKYHPTFNLRDKHGVFHIIVCRIKKCPFSPNSQPHSGSST